MDREEKLLRELLKSSGYDLDGLFESDILNDKERNEQLVGILSDIIKNKSNNSSKVTKVSSRINGNDFYLGFISDSHSRLYLLENYLKQLNSIGGKCVVTGDVSNGSNHFHGHDSSLKESLNLTNDVLSIADIMKRYPDMFIGYVEGNHDQWITEGTSLALGYLACKIAGVDSIYAKNIELVTQVTRAGGKDVPFNFLVVHGEGMSSNILNALKVSLSKACSQNVDAIIFGHTHKMGSASTTILRKIGNGTWQEKQVMSYNAGSVVEASDYADKAGYPLLTPFDGAVLHCSVVKGKSGEYKKCIDLENINNVLPKNEKGMLKNLHKNLKILEGRKYKSKAEIQESYFKIVSQYASKNFQFQKTNDGQYIISISGTSDMYSPNVTEDVRKKIKKDLTYIISVAKNIPNLSIVLNGDLIQDYNKGYILKKDYVANTVADLQDLCEILRPVADKICAINNGKMEDSIMSVERDKAVGRIGNRKGQIKELANYATHVLQLDVKEAYAHFDRQEMRTKQLAIQNDAVNQANQRVLEKEYDDFLKLMSKKPEVLDDIFVDEKVPKSKKEFEKRVKGYLVENLRREHKILDITNPEDEKIIKKLYPLSEIDLRMPNENLVGNIICKMLNISPKAVKVGSVIGTPSIFSYKESDGKVKTVYASYCTSLPKFLRELPSKLNSFSEPPDVVLVNSYVTKTSSDLQEFTTQIRMSYFDSHGEKKVKDVQVIDSGSFAYGKYLTNGRIPTNMLYKLVDVEPIFNSILPKDSVGYTEPSAKRPVVEKYNYESVENQYGDMSRIVKEHITRSITKTLNKYDESKRKRENDYLNKLVADQFDELQRGEER